MWKSKALNHAIEQDPKESCGLLGIVKGKEKYFPCKNLAVNSNDQFIIDPLDWVKVEDSGAEITGIVHSHPKTSPQPSEADKVACEKTGIKWYIVQPNLKQWVEFEPSGYKASLIGRPYVYGVHDCWSLVRDYYHQELGIILKDWDRPINPEDFRESPMFETCFKNTGFRELTPEEDLIKNDLLLMSMRSKGLNHIGVFLGDQVLLHHMENRLSSRDLYDEWLLKCTGMRLRYVA